jgi:ubiquinone/menaquinone biosynthesis C-methylase UbiE
MKWPGSGASSNQTELAMIGAKPGDRVLVIGAGDGRLAAALGLVTGLNGRTLVVDRAPGAQARVEAAARRAGALVDFDGAAAPTLALGDATFDVVVLPHELSARPAEVARLASEAARVVRPGGRVMVIEETERTGFRRLLTRDAPKAIPTDEIRTLLSDAGLRAARVLAEVDGVAYVDAVKPRLRTANKQ